MEIIERGYAIIYVDRKGESLNEDDYTTKDMITDYYKNSGFLQWNFYLIVAEEAVEDQKTKIEQNETYTRKYVMPESEIDSFVASMFPLMNIENGSISLIKGSSWNEAISLAMSKIGSGKIYPSWYRDLSMMDSIKHMDELRARLISDPTHKAVFCTHISNEFFLV